MVKDVNGIRVVALRQDNTEVKTLRIVVDQWRNKLGSGVVLVFGVNEEKVTMIAGVSKDLSSKLSAGKLISTLAPTVGGKGGGKPELAQGGGPDRDKADTLIEATYQWVRDSI